MRFIATALMLWAGFLAGCSTPASTSTVKTNAPHAQPASQKAPKKPDVINVREMNGKAVTVHGKAIELPDHAEKSNGFGVAVGTDELLFAGDYRPLPANVLGSRIQVSGTVRKRNLPMFHQEPGGGASVQGIPVPPGTDIAKESIYYVLEDPIWTLATP